MKIYWVKCRKDTENIDPKWLEQKITDSLCKKNALFAELKSQDL